MGIKLNMLKMFPSAAGVPITCWSDAAFANQAGSRSTMGQVFSTPYGVLSWRSKTIPGVPLSSTEAEIISLVFSVRELIFLRVLFADLAMAFENSPPSKIFEDNTASIQIASQVGVSDRTKHMQIKYHFLRHKLEMEVFTLEYLNTKKMLADLLTKPLPGSALYPMLTSITRLEMGGVGPGIDLTLDDDQSDPTEASLGLDDAIADRIQEIQSGGDWRKTKALRQKHLSRKEGATVTKRSKKSTKALWKQALVTRSAVAESQSDSELGHDSHDLPGRVEHSAATTMVAQSLPQQVGPFPPLEGVVTLPRATGSCSRRCVGHAFTRPWRGMRVLLPLAE